MEFLNIGTGELIFILLIAILLVGPRRAVELVQQVGQLVARLRQEWMAVQRSVVTEVDALKKEAEALKQEALSPEVVTEVEALAHEARAGVDALREGVEAEEKPGSEQSSTAQPGQTSASGNVAPREDATE